MKKQIKTDILTRAVSTALLTNSVFFLCFFKFCMFAENSINIGFQQKQKRKVNTINKFYKLKWSKYKLKIGPSMLCNINGPVFNI